MKVSYSRVYRVIFVLLIVQLAAAGFCIWSRGGGLVNEAQAAKVYEDFEHAIQAVKDMGQNKACDKVNYTEACPPKDDERAYRLQVQIPGVGKRCYYPGPAGEVGKWEVKTCNYMPGDEDLRHWIVAIYKFGVGLALALAVLMIMVGGFQRILAAGVSQKISNANTTIIAAISGAVLALGSYALLYTLDVRLTQFEELVPAPIKMAVQSERWCNRNPEKINNRTLWYYKKGSKLEEAFERDLAKDGVAGSQSTDCGFEYEFGYFTQFSGNKPVISSFQKQPGTCFGVYCKDAGKTCVTTDNYVVGNSTVLYCTDAKKFCEDSSKKVCLEADAILRDTMTKTTLLDHSCSFLEKVDFFKDVCYFGEILVCPGNSSRVSCIAGPATENVGKKNEEGACWFLENGLRIPKKEDRTGVPKYVAHCVDPSDVTYPNKKANMVCCFDGTKYTLVKDNVLDCEPTINQKCSGYMSKDACTLDICKLEQTYGFGCRWDGTQCVKQ